MLSLEYDEDEEFREVFKEIGPTDYDIVDLPFRKKDLEPFFRREIEFLTKEIASLEEKKYNPDSGIEEEVFSERKNRNLTILNMLKRSLEEKVNEGMQEKDYDRNFGIACLYRKTIFATMYTPAQRRKYDVILNKLYNPKTRESYNKELQSQIDAKLYERKLERERLKHEKIEEEQRRNLEIKRAELERNREYRELVSKEVVEEELGSDFRYDFSKYRFTEAQLERDRKVFDWKVNLLRNKKLLFKTQTRNKRYPELDENIEVYYYGSFDFSGDMPSTDANSCGIIGVKKKDIDGNISKYILLAQTRYAGYFDEITQQEYEQALRNGIKIYKVLPEEYERMSGKKSSIGKKSTTTRASKTDREEFDEIFRRLSFERRPIPRNGAEFERAYTFDKVPVLIMQDTLIATTPEEQEKFGRVFLSNYMINNAILNNSGFVGSLKGDKVLTDGGAIVRAISYAMKRPGKLVDGYLDRVSRVPSLETILEIIKDREAKGLIKTEKRQKADDFPFIYGD